MIVAVDSFNMGAMENKGLNVFNSRCVLGNMNTATDENLYDIQAVIGHEYFHNWTGNRVTCRDWFQLTLKEGLTVFRDQEFSSDLNSRAVKRITDVNFLRMTQFEEDAGPFAHPIKPNKYIEINNFYTLTVYEKGSEVIRMIQTLIGKDNFEKGITKYFELFDGQAVRTEDFLYAMEIASDFDFSKFKNWYDIKGTPHVDVQTQYDQANQKFLIDISQSFKNFDQNDLMSIPLNIKLIGQSGKSYPLVRSLSGESKFLNNGECLFFQDKSLKLEIPNIPEKCYLSLNRNFSSPITISRNWDEDEIYQLLLLEDDHFNKWDYGQTLFKKNILENLDNSQPQFDARLLECFQKLLIDKNADNHFKAKFMTLPSEMELNETLTSYRFDDVHRVRNALSLYLAKGLEGPLSQTFNELDQEQSNDWNADVMGKRALKNTVLEYLFQLQGKFGIEAVKKQYHETQNMTDRLACLMMSNRFHTDLTVQMNDHFIKEWKHQDLVVQKWFSAQAVCPDKGTLERIKEIEQSTYFDKKIPNHIYTLFAVFIGNNLINFHRADGEGYRYVVDKIIEIDSFNPQVASRMIRGLKNLKKLDSERRKVCINQLKRITSRPKISKDTYEVVNKILQYQ